MKKLLLFFIPFICLNTSFAQCLQGDCKNGQGTYLFASGAKYLGQFANGKSEGIGICYWKDGSRYEGAWKAGLPHGQGIKTFADGKRQTGWFKDGRYIGEKSLEELQAKAGAGSTARKEVKAGCVSGNCQNGRGVYVFVSGAVYTGEFKNGEIHGVGVCHYADGSQYKGEWVHRQPHGQGTLIFADGRQRSGFWQNGQAIDNTSTSLVKSQQQQATVSNIEVQNGCLSGDCNNGYGVKAFIDGSRYEGTFQQGKPNGHGTFFYPNGEKYKGQFKDGVPNGKGTLFLLNGHAQDGHWIDGDYIGIQQQPEKGCIEGDCLEGRGTYIFKEGDKYIGSFRKGLPHGRGTVHYANGERYDGEMANAKFNGYGTLFMKDGTQVSGYWRDGVYVGPQKQVAVPNNQQAQPTNVPELEVWALVIGVAAYNHMPVLRYTDDDAYRMYAFLKSPEGGALDDDHIKILIDEEATASNIKRTMNEIFGKAGPNDLILLYFSGHGLRGSFLPFDFDGYRNQLLHDEINSILKRSRAKYKLCIADACHSGSLLAMRGAGAPSQVLADYYRKLAQTNSGTALIMSSKSDETSLESSGLRQGVFSHFLIRGLKGEADMDNDKYVSVKELYDYVERNVRSYTRNMQSPLIQGNYDPDMPVAVRRR